MRCGSCRSAMGIRSHPDLCCIPLRWCFVFVFQACSAAPPLHGDTAVKADTLHGTVPIDVEIVSAEELRLVVAAPAAGAGTRASGDASAAPVLAPQAVEDLSAWAGVGKQHPHSSLRSAAGAKEARLPLEALERIHNIPPPEGYQVALPPSWVHETILRESRSAALEAREAEKGLRALAEDWSESFSKLRPSQIEGVRFGIMRRGRCLIADEMGLGKTLQALFIAQHYAEEWPLLIIAPKAVLSNWRDEITKWFPHLYNEVEVVTDGKHFLKHKLIRIVSYNLAALHSRFRVQQDGNPFNVVFFDEAHYMKSSKTVRAQALLPVCKAARRCILLTGTAVLNSASEIWTLLSALMRQGVEDISVPSLDDFCRRYAYQKWKRNGFEWEGAKRTDELNALLSGTFMIRRQKVDVLELAPKERHLWIIEEDKLDRSATKKLFAMLSRSEKQPASENYAALFSSIAAQGKAAAVADYVADLLSREAKVVVFAHHLYMHNKIQKRLSSLGVKHIRIDGSTPAHQRAKYIAKFQTDSTVRVALMGLLASSQGIDLTAARVVVFGELCWVPGRLLQAEDRVHRHGQKRSVEIHYCVAAGFMGQMDRAQLRKLGEKEVAVSKILDREVRSDFALLDASDPVSKKAGRRGLVEPTKEVAAARVRQAPVRVPPRPLEMTRRSHPSLPAIRQSPRGTAFALGALRPPRRPGPMSPAMEQHVSRTATFLVLILLGTRSFWRNVNALALRGGAKPGARQFACFKAQLVRALFERTSFASCCSTRSSEFVI